MYIRFIINHKYNYLSAGSIVETDTGSEILQLTGVNLEYPLTAERVEQDYEDINFNIRDKTLGRRFYYTLQWDHLVGEELRRVRRLLAYSDYGDRRNLLGVGRWNEIAIRPLYGYRPPSAADIIEHATFARYFPPLADVVIEGDWCSKNLKNKYINYFENVELVVKKRKLDSFGYGGGFTPSTEVGGIT